MTNIPLIIIDREQARLLDHMVRNGLRLGNVTTKELPDVEVPDHVDGGTVQVPIAPGDEAEIGFVVWTETILGPVKELHAVAVGTIVEISKPWFSDPADGMNWDITLEFGRKTITKKSTLKDTIEHLEQRLRSEHERAESYKTEAESYKRWLENTEDRIDKALLELGVPTNDYPAPVANAVNILAPNRSYVEELCEEPQTSEMTEIEVLSYSGESICVFAMETELVEKLKDVLFSDWLKDTIVSYANDIIQNHENDPESWDGNARSE